MTLLAFTAVVPLISSRSMRRVAGNRLIDAECCLLVYLEVVVGLPRCGEDVALPLLQVANELQAQAAVAADDQARSRQRRQGRFIGRRGRHRSSGGAGRRLEQAMAHGARVAAM